MAAAPLVYGQNNFCRLRIKLFDQFINERAADQRMVDQAQKQAVRSLRKTTNGGLNRAELAAFPIRIDYDFVGSERDIFRDGLGMSAQDNSANSNFGVHGHLEQMLEERTSLIGEQCLRGAHAAGSAAREDHGGQHV